MYDLIRFSVGALVFFGLCGLAIWRGGWPERTVAVAILVGSFLTPVVQIHGSADGLEPWVFLIDFSFMLLVVGVALKSDRWWPLFCAAYALLVASSHFARSLNEGIRQYAYISGAVLWSYAAVLALGLGVWELERRRRLAR